MPTADAAAVAQHRQPVGDRVDLFEEMRNEHDGEAARPQIADDIEQPRRLGRVETGGRLVEHQHARVVFQRARDGDELLHGDGIGAERACSTSISTPSRCIRARARTPAAAPIDEAEAPRQPAERQVVRHRQRRDEIDFLIDGADPGGARVGGGGEAQQPAVEPQFAGVGQGRAGHDLDERRFAGAVLAEQRMDLAGGDAEVDVVERAHPGIGLARRDDFNAGGQ